MRGLNPGYFTGPGTNTYIVGTAGERTLIDAGDAHVPGYVRLLERILREQCGGARISRIVITHAHPDHIGGCAAVAAACGSPGGVSYHKVPWPGRDAGLPIQPVTDGETIAVDSSCTLRAIATPGHAPDHVCWCLEEESALFSGDNILGFAPRPGLPLPPTSPRTLPCRVPCCWPTPSCHLPLQRQAASTRRAHQLP